MNRMTKEYIERLPEAAREFARRCDEGRLADAPRSGLTTSEQNAIWSAVADLRQFAD
jgi:hypothetical protein